MVCAFNKVSQILVGIGAILFVIGTICHFSAGAAVSEGLNVELEGGQTEFTYDAGGACTLFCSHDIFMSSSEECMLPQSYLGNSYLGVTEGTPATTVRHVATGANATVTYRCTDIQTPPPSWQTDHDPPLRRLGYFTRANDPTDPNMDESGTCWASSDHTTATGVITSCLTLSGEYRITSAVNVWTYNPGEEIGEAVDGFFAALGLAIISYILYLIGSILLCVACCCMCQGPDTVVVIGQGTTELQAKP